MSLKLKLKLGFFLLLSMACVYGGYTMDRNGRASGGWQSTSGVVIDSHVVEVRSYGKGTHVEYIPQISYEYESPHGLLRSDKMTYAGPGAKAYRFQAEKVVAQYEPGISVTVYYNPKNPRQACLEPGRTRDGIAFIVIGVLLFLAVLIFLGFRQLDRYAGMGEFLDTDVNKKAEETIADLKPKKKKEPSSSLLREYIQNAQKSNLIIQHIETHLFFGPMYRRTRLGDIFFTILGTFFGKRLSLYTDDEQLFFVFLVTKIFLGGLAILFVFVSPFLFLMKAPDATADLLLGLIWLPGLEFIPRVTPKQKYITVCRLLLTIPAVYMGINSGNWSW